ncbi:ABC transporter permease [Phaeovulum vinaykumarii]|uniref:Putative spermidine/putrescine transport system permease protein n=1 Tax=Phaeovulum vinaykumarii TaxID=407234 RepID=A0A1N7MGN5_9RHOB|nr:ABC transporter permease [Phaeovulum vinaykumarii]SIS85314.1 putative spermidine/putrescine transport system permease protein [Phaeovulum vinaykumarii]SOC12195.1 putative spermidine/putrescine transport system permease protein [Phaeovulum vinaykumarii]
MSDASAAVTDPDPGSGGPLSTADGQPLKVALAQSQKRARRRALMLVAPLFAFVIFAFVLPIGQMLFQSVYNPTFSDAAPNLVQWFDEHPQGSELDESAYAALAADLKLMRETKTAGVAGTRINYDVAGTRSLFTSSARKAAKLEPPYKPALLEIDEDWGDPEIWRAMRSASQPFTIDFYLAAIDLTRDAEGHIVSVPEDRAVYVMLFQRTLALSALITALCILLGFPIAHLLATLPLARSNILMIFVLLPFWTSLLVRTTSWMVLLQSQGVVNDLLVAVGIIGEDGRIQMMYNQIGTVVAMTHILLPFMVLPLYSVMRPIPPSYVRAARSLGATSWTAFRRIYLPQTLPGIGAGSLLVFILAIGYYITPALVGGADGQLVSNLIAFHMQKSLNWSLAAALAGILLGGVLILYWLYDRLVGIDNLKLG